MLYIVAIAWMYVVILMSLTETSFVAGAATFIFYGVLPLSVLLYLLGTPMRWRAQRVKAQQELEALRAQQQPNGATDPTLAAHVAQADAAPERAVPKSGHPDQ
jgi:type VI protein secretion system component VasK